MTDKRYAAAPSSEPNAGTPCCGNYAACMRPCTPRGRWLAVFRPEENEFMNVAVTQVSPDNHAQAVQECAREPAPAVAPLGTLCDENQCCYFGKTRASECGCVTGETIAPTHKSKLPLSAEVIAIFKSKFIRAGGYEKLCDQALAAITLEQRVAELERENAELKPALATAKQQERERCAKVCEGTFSPRESPTGCCDEALDKAARAIRALTDKEES